jgi:hypothetical protein
MRSRSKLLFVIAGAALLLSMAVSSASARDFSITNRAFRIVWSRLYLATTGNLIIECPVTLEGSFHSATIHKTIDTRIGYMTRGAVVGGSCGSGQLTINQEALPWHIRYGGFSGALPEVTGILVYIIGAKFTMNAAGTCVSLTTAANPARAEIGLGEGGRASVLVADERALIPLRSVFFCQFVGQLYLVGIGGVTLLGNTTTISIRLI